jgi:hypothetical protein
MPNKRIIMPFESDRFYHIYRRGNNGECTYFKKENYILFINKYFHYLGEYLNTYAYALLPNHFHFLIKVKFDSPEANKEISNQFRKLFVAYTQLINFQEERSGNLYHRGTRRIQIYDSYYLKRLVFYIHNNPVKHEISPDFTNYPYSSFASIVSNTDDRISRKELLSWFNNDVEEFKEFHSYLHDDFVLRHHIIE